MSKCFNEFSALVSAVVSDGAVDATAALALADYLNERDDERGTRLRNRVKRFENAVNWIYEIGRMFDPSEGDSPERAALKRNALARHMPWRKRHLESENATFTNYFFRLMSVASGDPLPRERVSGTYVMVEPKA